MKKCFAVMDLGTNTFHLMIAEESTNGFNEIAHDNEAVKLGEGGINKGFIQQNAFERGIKTMQRFAEKIKQHDVKEVKAIATSALRNASNGQEFITTVKQNTGIEIEIIDGLTEATYIYKGVKASDALSEENTSLIIDIGGGSVEFIICTQKEMLWKHSFEIGAARLIERFHQIDPIPGESVKQLNQYLDEMLQPLFDATQGHHIKKLIGSAGAFETFTEVIELEKQFNFEIKKIKTYDFDLDEFICLTNHLIASSNSERKAIKGIIALRVAMIVVASLITRFVMEKLNIRNVGMSTYSLKEGVMAGLVNPLK